MNVVFFSHKGGAGRTAAVANVAAGLARAGYRVLAVDFDLRAPGLHRYFGLEDADTCELVGGIRPVGIVDLVHEFRDALRSGRRGWPVKVLGLEHERLLWPRLPETKDATGRVWMEDEVRGQVLGERLGGDSPAWVKLLPAGGLDGSYVRRAASIPWRQLYAPAAYRELFERLRSWLSQLADFTLIDASAGATDSGALCALVLADRLVLMSPPSDQAADGAVRLIRRLRDLGSRVANHGALFVPCRVAKDADAEALARWRQRTQAAISVEELRDTWTVTKGSDPDARPDRIRRMLSDFTIPEVPLHAVGETLVAQRLLRRATERDPLLAAYERLAAEIRRWVSRPEAEIAAHGNPFRPEDLEQAAAGAARQGDLDAAAWLRHRLAQLALDGEGSGEGGPKRALEAAHVGRGVAEGAGNERAEAALLRVEGEAHARLADLKRAADRLERSVELLARLTPVDGEALQGTRAVLGDVRQALADGTPTVEHRRWAGDIPAPDPPATRPAAGADPIRSGKALEAFADRLTKELAAALQRSHLGDRCQGLSVERLRPDVGAALRDVVRHHPLILGSAEGQEVVRSLGVDTLVQHITQGRRPAEGGRLALLLRAMLPGPDDGGDIEAGASLLLGRLYDAVEQCGLLADLHQIRAVPDALPQSGSVDRAPAGFGLGTTQRSVGAVPEAQSQAHDLPTGPVERALGEASTALLEWPRALGTAERVIQRPELETLRSKVLTADHTVVALLGPPGSGKSALLSSLAHELTADGVACLALKADLLPAHVDTRRALRLWLGLPAPAVDCFRALAHERRVVVLLDQLDALCSLVDVRTGRLSTLLDFVEELRGIDELAVIVSCRSFEYRYDVRFQRLEADKIELSLPSWEAVKHILEAEDVPADGWPDDSQSNLRLPQRLKLFLAHRQTLPRRYYDSYQRMLEDIWQQRVVGGPGSPRRAAAARSLARRVSGSEELWVPRASLEGYEQELRELEAVELVSSAQEGTRVGFCHQTVFDFVRARAFVTEGTPLWRFVLERQDALFVRPILWSTLTHLRAAANERYLDELSRLWERPDLRRHVRWLLLDLLGQVRQPADEEATWLFEALDAPTLAPRALAAIDGHAAWFERLDQAGRLARLMDVPAEDAWPVVRLLQHAWPFARDRVLGLLEAYWLAQPERDPASFRTLEHLEDWDESAAALVEVILSRTPVAVFLVDLLAGRVAEATPELAVRIVAAKLRADLARAQAEPRPSSRQDQASDGETEPLWAEERDRRPAAPFRRVLKEHAWRRLPGTARAAPAQFLEAVLPVFAELVEGAAYEPQPEPRSYRGDRSHWTFEGNIPATRLVVALAAALQELARTAPDEFTPLAERWSRSDLLSVHRLLARGYRALAAADPAATLRYLLADPRRLAIVEPFENEDETRALLRELAPHLGRDEVRQLELAVLSWQPYGEVSDDDADSSRRAFRKRLALLAAFPEDRLTEESRALLDAAQDAPAGATRTSGLLRAETDPAAMPDLSGLSEERLLAFLAEHPDSFDVAHSFAELAVERPEDVLRVLRQLTPSVQERPAARALPKLAKAGNITLDALVELVIELDGRGFSGAELRRDAAWALHELTKAPAGLPEAACELLERWLSESPPWEPAGDGQPWSWEPETPAPSEPTQDRPESVLWGHGTRLLPGGNLPVLLALTYGYLTRRPPETDAWMGMLERHLGRRENPDVWQALAHHLRWLRHGDLERAIGILDRLFDRVPEVLASRDGAILLAWAHEWAPSAPYAAWLERLRLADWVWAPQAFGELVTLRALSVSEDAEAMRRVEALLEGPAVESDVVGPARVGCALSAAHVWATVRRDGGATRLLARLLEVGDTPVVRAVLDVFRLAEDVTATADVRVLLDAMADHPSLVDAEPDSFVFERLADLVPQEPQRIYRICSTFLRERAARVADIRSHLAMAAEPITEIAVSLQRFPDYRAKGVELFELLMEAGVPEAEQALLEIDRRPRAGFRARPLRQRKGARQG